MNLYLIWQTVNTDYDTYDSAVVAAPDEHTARRISPSAYADPEWYAKPVSRYGTWVALDDVRCELIGTAVPGTAQGIIVSSFNAV